MLTITLGTQASGSTWLFNVVRLLNQAAGRAVTTLSADEGVDALDRLPLDVGDVVLKAHALDQRLVRIARLAGARLIVSTRDPRDSVVSQAERFGATLPHAAADISRAFASIASLPPGLRTLRFAYESGFTRDPGAVEAVARFIGLPAEPATVADIVGALAPDAVRRHIDAMVAALPADAVPCHDPVTQWHPNHVGDGRTGKWRDRLNAVEQAVVAACLCPLEAAERWQTESVVWPAELFTGESEAAGGRLRVLRCGGGADYLAYGPYLHLPRGRWRATPDLRALDAAEVPIVADIFLPWEDRVAASGRGAASTAEGTPPLALAFDHGDHFQPIEARLFSVEGAPGTLGFGGWRLDWLGPLEDGGEHTG